MKNLVIIGNGFDLAHGFKTKYSDFIKDLRGNLVKYVKNVRFSNAKILKALLQDNQELWSDIECAYYDILTHLGVIYKQLNQ